jgi:hypothetical protein
MTSVWGMELPALLKGWSAGLERPVSLDALEPPVPVSVNLNASVRCALRRGGHLAGRRPRSRTGALVSCNRT